MEDAGNDEEVAVVITNVYGDICYRKARRKRQKALVREMFYDYANNTTLHGLSYTTKRGLTLIEKIFWLITFIASVCLCCFLIHNVWIKWQTSPVMVTVSEQLVSVRKVPFPSVTICPSMKIKTSDYNYTGEKLKFDGILKNITNISEVDEHYIKEFRKFDDLTNVCGSYLYSYEFYNAFPRQSSGADVANNIINAAPKKKDLFYYCVWHGKFDSECENTVVEVLTSDGLCYNINALAADEILREDNINKDHLYLASNTSTKCWSVEHGYSSFNSNVYPVPGKENGMSPDLEIIFMDNVTEHDEACNVVNSGYKVYVQHPADLPQASLYYYAVLNDQVSSMALSFNILNTTETLRKYDPEVRQCYFPEERYLKYFKIYTANNCRIECVTNFTYQVCGCVGFYMPRESNRPICTTESNMCIINAQAELEDREAEGGDIDCHCLPACNSIDYEAEILKTNFNLMKLVEVDSRIHKRSIDLNGTKFSKLEMYFKKPRFLSMRRSELFGVTDFFANIGGLLGLFLGFSFLSLVELAYFVTLRLCCTLRKDLKEEKIQRTNTIEVPKKY